MDTICLAKKEEVLARLAGDETLLHEIVQMYFEDYPVLLSHVERAIATNSASSLTQAAHDLKGLLSNFSSPKVTAAIQALEQTGKLNQMENGQTRLEALCRELEILSSDLKKWTNQL